MMRKYIVVLFCFCFLGSNINMGGNSIVFADSSYKICPKCGRIWGKFGTPCQCGRAKIVPLDSKEGQKIKESFTGEYTCDLCGKKFRQYGTLEATCPDGDSLFMYFACPECLTKINKKRYESLEIQKSKELKRIRHDLKIEVK